MLTVYLSGEIHTDWRDQIAHGARDLNVVFTGPVTDHAASDDSALPFWAQNPTNFGTITKAQS